MPIGALHRIGRLPWPTDEIKNVTVAAGKVVNAVVTGNTVIASKEEVFRRMAICSECEFFTGTTCKKCGCVIRFKAMLNTEHCPLPEPKW